MKHDLNYESFKTKMNEEYSEDVSSDKYPKWNNTKSTLNGTKGSTANIIKENEAKNPSIDNIVHRLVVNFLPTSVYRFCRALISSYEVWSFGYKDLQTFAELNLKHFKEYKLFNISKRTDDTKMSVAPIFTKLLCMSVAFFIGVIVLLCMINVTYSTTPENLNKDSDAKILENDDLLNRHSRKFATFKSSARTSEELLNDITTYGLERSRYLYEIKEKRIYDKGISLKKSDPAHFVAVFNKQTPRAKELSRYGYATLEASTLLTKR